MAPRFKSCSCGALYERREEKVPFRDKDSFSCLVCGEELESWNGSRIPVFGLIKRPPADAPTKADDEQAT
jgi:hypothetical protein